MSSQILFLYEWSERDVPIKDVLNGRESWVTLPLNSRAKMHQPLNFLINSMGRQLPVDERNRIERGKAMELASTFVTSWNWTSISGPAHFPLLYCAIVKASSSWVGYRGTRKMIVGRLDSSSWSLEWRVGLGLHSFFPTCSIERILIHDCLTSSWRPLLSWISPFFPSRPIIKREAHLL